MKVRTGHLYQRKAGGPFYIQIRIDGKTITKRLTDKDGNPTANRRDAETLKSEFMQPYLAGDAVDTLKAVQSKLADRQAEVDAWEAEQNPPPPLAHIWHRFEQSPARPDSGDNTLKVYGFKWQRFRAWLEKNHPEKNHLHEVTSSDAERYIQDLTAAKVSASTFNQHRNLLRMVWRVLADECRLTGNPWDRITPRKLNSLATRKRALTPGQFDSLLAAVEGNPDLHDLFTVLAWTGLRLADAVLMKWGAVDFSSRVISLAPIKTARRMGKLVYIPIFPAVLDVLNRRQAGRVLNPKGFVFPELAAQYERDASAISKAISAAFDRAGIETTEKRTDRKKAVIVYGAHSLRHYFVTQATAAGMPGAMIKSITGHGSDGMLEHYQQIGADLAADLAGRISGGSVGMLADTQPPPTDAAGGELEVLRGRILELAGQLDGKNWKIIRAELIKAVDNMSDMA